LPNHGLPDSQTGCLTQIRKTRRERSTDIQDADKNPVYRGCKGIIQ